MDDHGKHTQYSIVRDCCSWHQGKCLHFFLFPTADYRQLVSLFLKLIFNLVRVLCPPRSLPWEMPVLPLQPSAISGSQIWREGDESRRSKMTEMRRRCDIRPRKKTPSRQGKQVKNSHHHQTSPHWLIYKLWSILLHTTEQRAMHIRNRTDLSQERERQKKPLWLLKVKRTKLTKT